MGICASKPAHKGEAETNAGTLTPGATATISPSLQGAKSTEQEILEQASGELPIAQDSYGAEEVQKPRSARTSFDARREGTSPGEGGADSQLSEDVTEASSSDIDDPQLLKEYTRLAEMLRYSPYPVTLIAIEEDNQPYVFVNNVGSLAFYTIAVHLICLKVCHQHHQQYCLGFAGVLRALRFHRHRRDWQVMVCYSLLVK